MSNNTVTIDAKTLERILSRLDGLAQEVKELKEKLIMKEPVLGSDEWWEWSDEKALGEIKKGNYTEFGSAKDMVSYLKTLK